MAALTGELVSAQLAHMGVAKFQQEVDKRKRAVTNYQQGEPTEKAGPQEQNDGLKSKVPVHWDKR